MLERFLFAGLLLGSTCAGASPPASSVVTLTGDTPWLVFTDATPPLDSFSLALTDIKRDWFNVLGYPPLVLSSVPSNSFGQPLVFLGSPDAIVAQISAAAQIPLGAADSHACAVLALNTTGNFTPIVCTGVGAMGEAYAVYALSQELLGVDPQAYWVDKDVGYIGEISLPADFVFTSGDPTFEYRGWFFNDEDMTSFSHPDPLGQAVFGVETCNLLFESLLRLRGNAVIMGTSGYVDETSYQLAAKRGIFIAEHHISPLGENTFRWPKGLPFSFDVNPEVLEYVWNAQVEMQKDRNMLWTVGYRGLNDYPFWNDEPWFNTDASRGALMSAAIAKQVEIVKNVTGQPQPLLFSYLWDEAIPLYEEGFLKFPEGVSAVHGDAGNGYFSVNASDISPGDGIYFHIMMESGNHNQLTEMVPPSRMYSSISQFVQKNATRYGIINVSDLRSVPLSARAIMEFLWNTTAALSVDPYVAEQQFFLKYAQLQYGPEMAAEVASVYTAYFNIPYSANNGTTHYGEQRLSGDARRLAEGLTAFFVNGTALPVAEAKTVLGYVSPAVGYLGKLSSTAVAIVPKLPAARQQFYMAHTVTQIATHLYLSTALDAVAEAVLAAASDRQSAADLVRTAVEALESIAPVQRAGSTQRSNGFYAGDQLTDLWNLRDVCRQTLAVLDGSPLPPARFWSFGTTPSSSWFAYMTWSNFPFYFDSPSNLRAGVLVSCFDNCQSTVAGGFFTSNTSIGLNTTDTTDNLEIRYTLDGSDPTNESTLYQRAIGITNTTTIRARSFSSGQISNAPITAARFILQSTG